MSNRSCISLFCGAGGLDLGFEAAGFSTVWANDLYADALATHASWCGGDHVLKDVSLVDPSEVPDADVMLGGFPCLAEGTPVLTARGAVPIEAVRPGDLVLSHDGGWHAVSAVFDQGEREVCRMRFGGGSVVATANHRFMTADGPAWTPVSEIARDFRDAEARLIGPGGERVRVDDVEPLDRLRHVWDLEVDGSHSFVAAGVLTHNCQGFSLAGPRRLDDSRNALYREYVRLLTAKRPAAFVGENVKGLLTMGGGEVFEAVLAAFSEVGYDVSWKLLDAADHGAAQDRRRVILVGLRRDLGASFSFPAPQERICLRDAIGPFGDADPADVCGQPYSSRYMSRNRRRGWDGRSFTVPAMAKQCPLWPGSPPMVRVGPDEWRFGDGGPTRRLSWREAAAVQGFPAGLAFSGDLVSKYRQVGNAVPPPLAEAVAREVARALSEAGV